MSVGSLDGASIPPPPPPLPGNPKTHTNKGTNSRKRNRIHPHEEHQRPPVHTDAHDKDLARRHRCKRVRPQLLLRKLPSLRHHLRPGHRPVLVRPHRAQHGRHRPLRPRIQKLDGNSEQRRLPRTHRHPREQRRPPDQHHIARLQHVDGEQERCRQPVQ